MTSKSRMMAGTATPPVVGDQAMAAAAAAATAHGDPQIGGDIVVPPTGDPADIGGQTVIVDDGSPIPGGSDPRDAEHRAIETNKAVAVELTSIQAERDEAIQMRDQAVRERDDALQSRVSLTDHEAVVTDRDALRDRVAELEQGDAGQIVQLQGKVDKLERQLVKAKDASGSKPAKPGKIGPMDGDDMLQGDALGEALLRTGDFSLVASDGERAIAEFEPIKVAGAEWQKRSGRFALTTPFRINGAGLGRGGADVAGFGLVNERGVQIGWSALADTVHVAAGTTVEFRDSIIF